ncbi:lysophospholipid acyltransferase family protein [Lactococcus protaetiae]|jgi:1-acyl-sn-glycerol-3-phosphate acyltransferase|uniref:1-acyl-sn-glycerol-3-phosphate acyltransferase n=1 Tax=Lactococcus protaetiae TaxID=2592653 RepID=A0A514Z6Z1_9LACT|nr:1-acyl-sn-glycerol-3-phosphate acyltransferase [Lactococcus protaetiae]MCL2112446.1 1-acyl-sn-glycerol-3-phosphate acyltransferase [Streptococcaceae bacterium]QDK70362.1 1-acyl-sn-glycerol-3-phosphate acyltransferase [Lactococcus protaetiae]
MKEYEKQHHGFYVFLRNLVAFLLFVLNGRSKYYNVDRIPKNENYILVAPHRMAWEPVWFAFATRPKQFIFMAKKELFEHKFGGWWIKMCGAFPVDRNNPGTKPIKHAVKMLKESNKSMIMFPSGSRHSSEMKGGVALIAKMANVRIVPAVYQGPLTMKGVFKRQKVAINFGEPIDISDIKKANAEGIEEVNRRMEEAFAALDKELNPNFHYEVK